MLQIIAIHLVGGTQHEHIESVKWVNHSDSPLTIYQSDKANMVGRVNALPRGSVIVDHGGKRSIVGVVEANPPYLRTYADGYYNDNLLALDQY